MSYINKSESEKVLVSLEEKRVRFGHTQTHTHTQGRSHVKVQAAISDTAAPKKHQGCRQELEEVGSRPPPQSHQRGRGPAHTLTLDLSFKNHDRINSCCLSPRFVVVCYGNPRRCTHAMFYKYLPIRCLMLGEIRERRSSWNCSSEKLRQGTGSAQFMSKSGWPRMALAHSPQLPASGMSHCYGQTAQG